MGHSLLVSLRFRFWGELKMYISGFSKILQYPPKEFQEAETQGGMALQSIPELLRSVPLVSPGSDRGPNRLHPLARGVHHCNSEN